MPFIIELLREKSSVTIKNDDRTKLATIKSGGSFTISDEVMSKCSKNIQSLLAINPGVITVNKVDENVKKVIVKKEVIERKISIEVKKPVVEKITPIEINKPVTKRRRVTKRK